MLQVSALPKGHHQAKEYSTRNYTCAAKFLSFIHICNTKNALVRVYITFIALILYTLLQVHLLILYKLYEQNSCSCTVWNT